MTSQVAPLPAALLHLYLDGLHQDIGHCQVTMFHSFIQAYFPEGGYHFSQLPFNLATPESMEGYDKKASHLANTLCAHLRVVIFLTTHSDEDRGDLFTGYINKEPVAAKAFEFLQLLLKPLTKIVDRTDMIFYVCGSLVTNPQNFSGVKEIAQHSTLIPSASHTGPTTRSYAHPLDENYARAYYEAHAKTFEVEQLLKQSAQVQSDLQSIVHVVVWAPRHIHVVNPTPGTFVPAAHQIITDLLTADKVSVYCQDLWFEQLLTAPLVVPKTDATVFLCDASLAVSDIIGLDVELSRVSTSRKHLPGTILETTSPLKCMTMLSVLGTAEEIEKKFPLAFPNTDFVLSTFYKHRKPFMDASALGLVKSRVALGHTEGGKWALLKADVERFMKEGSLNMGSSVNTLSLPSTFNPSLLPQDSNQQDVRH
ncbi:hypothetical protein EDC04DRAFT_2943068 [Pisolithus marmoratus]|nr:hypothetical protein EDC04DRAFT_2943068 [Pisolithus marmoratus]